MDNGHWNGQWALSATDVAKSFGGLKAVDVETFRVPANAITGIIGPNGAGKSTLINLLTGFEKPDSGQWSVMGEQVTRTTPWALSQAGLVRTFQLTRNWDEFTLLENLVLSAARHPGRTLFGQFRVRAWRNFEDAARQKGLEVLDYLGLTKLKNAPAGDLSGGQRKLLELARALMMEPRVLLLDEPMAGVNPALRLEIVRVLVDLPKRGCAVAMVEHDLELVMNVSDHLIVMAEGRVVAAGPPLDVRNDPVVVSSFLGGVPAASEPAGASRTSASIRPVDGASESRRRPAVLQVDGLEAGYRPGLSIVRGCSLQVGQGELVGVIGPNGSGKSTLMKSVLGLVPRTAGKVTAHGKELSPDHVEDNILGGIAYVPQRANIFPRLTVEENLRIGLSAAGRSASRDFDWLYERFTVLSDRRNQRCGLMSGGERQMVAIARAMVARPSILLVDEPTAGLSPPRQADVFGLVRGLANDGVSVLMVEQNASACLGHSDWAYVLDQGRVVHEGTGSDLLSDGRIVELYLGAMAERPDEQEIQECAQDSAQANDPTS